MSKKPKIKIVRQKHKAQKLMGKGWTLKSVEPSPWGAAPFYTLVRGDQ